MDLKKLPWWAYAIAGAAVVALATGVTYGGYIMDILKIKELIARYRGVPFAQVPAADQPASITRATQWMSTKEKNFLVATPLDKIFDIGTLYQMNPDTVAPRSVVSIASSPAEFVAKVKGAAMRAAAQHNYDPMLYVAQAAHESNWGRNAVGGTNLFGHIASPKWSAAGAYSYASTAETVNGAVVPAYRPFRMYSDLDSAFMAHAAILAGSRYANAQGITDPYTWGRTIAADGYATANPDIYGQHIRDAFATVLANW